MHTGLGYFPLRTDYGTGLCAECGAKFIKTTRNQKFCRAEHQVAANNRRSMKRQKAQRKARKEVKTA